MSKFMRTLFLISIISLRNVVITHSKTETKIVLVNVLIVPFRNNNKFQNFVVINSE